MQQQTLKLNEICEIITSPVDKKSYKDETPVLLCNYTDVYYNEFITKNINFMEATASDNEIKKYSLYKGDVVITKDSETPDDIGISTYIAEDIENLVCGYHLAILRPNTKYVNGLYLAYYLKLQQVLNIFGRFANGITRYSLINATYKAIPVLLPPLAEQEKIAEILSLWDKAIEQTKELIAYKEKQKKGLMQNLLTGKKRLPGFTDEWKTVKLGDCFTFIKGQGLSKEKINSSGKYFCILYGELYTTYTEVIQQVVSKTNHAEGILSKSGDILIPCSTTTKAIDLATASSIKIDDVYIGADINILRPKININSDFIAFNISNIIKNTIAKYAQGSTIIHLYGKDIKPIKIKLPTIYEQNNIVNILCKADKEIELLKKQLDLYMEQKKGLMQNLLTGKVRVTV